MAKGQVLELILQDGLRFARISCPANLIPSAGQYLLASDASDAPLPVPLFHTDFAPQGFIASSPLPGSWTPGYEIYLRGPLGRGFSLPSSARKVGLVAFDDAPARLRGLIYPSLRQGAAVVLVSDFASDRLPDEVEVQPLSALTEIFEWADYLALDVSRENLNQMRERLGKLDQLSTETGRVEQRRNEAQILIRTPVPCGGVAECGVCAVTLRSGWKMACKDGPVFDWKEI